MGKTEYIVHKIQLCKIVGFSVVIPYTFKEVLISNGFSIVR